MGRLRSPRSQFLRNEQTRMCLLIDAGKGGSADLVKQLHERALDLAVGGGALAEAAPADGINLVLEKT